MRDFTKTHMKNSRYRVELAYALISATLFKHNEEIRAKNENRCAPTVAFQSSVIDATESFGNLYQVYRRTAMRSDDSKVEMDTLKYNEMLTSIDISAYEVEPLQTADVAPEEAFTMLKQAISAYYVTSTLSKFSKTASFSRCFHVLSISCSENMCRFSR